MSYSNVVSIRIVFKVRFSYINQIERVISTQFLHENQVAHRIVEVAGGRGGGGKSFRSIDMWELAREGYVKSNYNRQ